MTKRQKCRVYLASPLFNDRERRFNIEIDELLSSFVDVFLPQRDGNLLTKLVAEGRSLESAREVIYRNDTAAIESSSVVIAVLDGRTVDEGVAFELGYARALGKVCIGFKSDDRSMLPTGDNPMILCACQYYCSSLEGLAQSVRLAIESRTDVDDGLICQEGFSPGMLRR